MVKVAVAGFGEVGREIVGAILAEGQHEVIVLSRRNAPDSIPHALNWVKVDYQDKENLVDVLRGVHTVLSFIVVHQDVRNESQKNLIDASIKAGVKRFAPSEWSFYVIDDFPFYGGKAVIREYLKEVNKARQVLEYCSFVPGVFMDYLGPPEKLSKNLSHTQQFVDFKNCRAILPEDSDATVSFTTVGDVAKLVTKALSYEGEWPTVGGIACNKITLSELLELGEKIRGRKFSVERVKLDDLKAGKLKTSWAPSADHPAIAPEQLIAAAEMFTTYSLLSIHRGDWDLPDQWNRLLPDFQYVSLEDFLRNSWEREF